MLGLATAWVAVRSGIRAVRISAVRLGLDAAAVAQLRQDGIV